MLADAIRTRRFILPLVVALMLVPTAFADMLEIEVREDLSVPIHRYPSAEKSAPVVLWLPTEQGLRPSMFDVAASLADLGADVWIPDLHAAYFVDAGRSSVDAFRDEDIALLIDALHDRTGRDIVLVGGARVAATVLRGIRALQSSSRPMSVRGAILFSPTLYASPPAPGRPATWLPVTRATNVPVFVIQPQIGFGAWRIDDLLDVLRSGGSTVFHRYLTGVQGGYLVRDDPDLTDADFDARAQAPAMLMRAIDLLRRLPAPDSAGVLADVPRPEPPPDALFGLKPIAGPAPTDLALTDIRGNSFSLEEFRGEPTLVSFWASWCSPCLQELPSLARLHRDFSPRGLEIVTVNVGEDAETIESVASEFSMRDYVLLRDPDGIEMKRWNVYGFPTNFLLDKAGALRFGSFGAVDWDDPDVRDRVAQLVN